MSSCSSSIFPALWNHQRHAAKLPRLDEVSRFSATRCHASALIAELLKMHVRASASTVWDAFGGAGADAIMFMLAGFKHVHVTECDASRARAIHKRLSVYAADRSLSPHCFSVEHGDSTRETREADVIFLDPPWGGPSYKKHEGVVLRLNGAPLGQVVESVYRPRARRLLVVKLPYNYNFAKDPQLLLPRLSKVYAVLRRGRATPVFLLVVTVITTSSSGVTTTAPRTRALLLQGSGAYALYSH